MAGETPRLDAAGTAHVPCTGAPRIVSLVPSLTELLFDLGLGAHVVGRTSFCVHPAGGVAAVPRVGGTKTVRIDRVLARRPTHVIVNVDENRREDAEALARHVPHLVVTHPLAPQDNPGLYRLLGGIFGREAEAEALCERFDAVLARLRAAVAGLPPRRVLYLIWRRPYMTVSRDTYIARTLALARWHTLPEASPVRYPVVQADAALAARTDLLLLPSEPFPFKPKHLAELRALDGWGRVPAALVDGEMASWYGSRAVQGLDYLARLAPRLAKAA